MCVNQLVDMCTYVSVTRIMAHTYHISHKTYVACIPISSPDVLISHFSESQFTLPSPLGFELNCVRYVLHTCTVYILYIKVCITMTGSLCLRECTLEPCMTSNHAYL